MLDALWSNIFRHHERRQQRIIDILGAVPIFSELSKRELRTVEKLVYVRRHVDGETIFEAGDPSLGMYIITVGSVHILRNEHDAKPKVIATLTAGDFFGEMGLIDDSPRSASAVACGDVESIGFFKPELLSVSSRNPELGLKIFLRVAKTLSARLRLTHQELDLLSRQRDRESDLASPRHQ